LPGGTAVIPLVVPVLAALLRAATMLALGGFAGRARGGRLVEDEAVDDRDEQVLAGHG